MKIRLLIIGKTTPSYLREGIEMYASRLKHYCDFEMVTLPDARNATHLPKDKLMDQEAEIFLKRIKPTEKVMLLDETGKEMSSPGFAKQLEKWNLSGGVQVAFVIGGAFGFGSALRERADFSLSLSRMTFSHQMVRLIFLEQLYRAFTILKGEPYHHS